MIEHNGNAMREHNERVVAELKEQFSGFPGAERFDPSTASLEKLQEFGLPPRPGRDADRQLQAAWREAFGRPMRLQQFQFPADLAVDGTGFQPTPRAFDLKAVSATRVETSSNWSGAYIGANADKKFLQIWGAWKIPDELSDPPPGHTTPGVPYTCANWIGLDGQRLYLDSSLPQMGTSSTLDPATQGVTATAWVQWWARQAMGSPDSLPLPIGLAVKPGDKVICVLTALTPHSVVCVMVKLLGSLPVGIAIKGKIPPKIKFPGNVNVLPDIAGATAEWILERPNWDKKPGLPCNFPNYRTTEFRHCLAVEGNKVDAASWGAGVVQDLQGARLLRMFDVFSDPSRTVFASMPKKLTEHSIAVTYGGFRGVPPS